MTHSINLSQSTNSSNSVPQTGNSGTAISAPTADGAPALEALLAQLEQLIAELMRRLSGGPAANLNCGACSQANGAPDMNQFMANLSRELDRVAANMDLTGTRNGPILSDQNGSADFSLLSTPLAQGPSAIRLDLGGN